MSETGPRALIITAPGINCDLELARAFEAAGAHPESHLLRELMRTPSIIDRFDLIGLPGGFSYGDDIAAGRIMAQLIRRSILPALHEAVKRRVPMICPCNGFQIAVQAGLLPSFEGGSAALPVVALAENLDARFHDRWTRIEVPDETICLWTRGLQFDQETGLLPSAHGEGRFVAPASVLDALECAGQVAMRYAEGENFNGSERRIAGICDPTGLILGLMPHPERYTRWTQHPWWTRLDPGVRQHETPGLAIFRNAVDWVRRGRPSHTSSTKGLAPCR
ncbi:MAG: phosphoribosylformylglycinamidine synthase subunit PurQ [Phycisphaeraceae bacterium]|nr:phosphoribosylformylglycinamidine synthase subunit PurQ [Phycisphaeraceae bacterium]